MLDVSVQGFCEEYKVSSVTRWFKETVVGQKRQEMRGDSGFSGVYTNTSES
jgi:hypothetical protein